MKKFYIVSALFLSMFLFLFNDIISYTNGAPAGRTGAPGELTCADGGCHVSNVNNGPATVSITSDIPASGYEPGQTYTVTASINDANINKFGFEALPFGSANSDGIGDVTITNANRTKRIPNGDKEYVTHISGGTSGSGSATWSFDWTAPATSGEGEVVFYASFNAANGNGNVTGDQIYTTSASFAEGVAGSIEDLMNIADAKVFPSVATDFVELEAEVTAATKIEIEVLDMNGRAVYRTSADALPGLFNQRIETASWEEGMYFVRVASGKGRTSFKVIVL